MADYTWAPRPPGYVPYSPGVPGSGYAPGNPTFNTGTGQWQYPATSPTYDPFGGGGGFNQAFSGGGGAGVGQGNWLSWFLPLISNLGQGYLGGKAQSKSEQANRDSIQDRIRQALAALSPQNINMLAQAFLPQIMAQLNPQAQTAIQGLSTSQGRRGLYQSPIGSAQEAGLRGQLAQAGPAQAFQQAMGLAGQQASAISGAPFAMSQPNYNYANAFGNAFNSALAGYSLTGKREPEPPSPYATALDFPKYGFMGR